MLLVSGTLGKWSTLRRRRLLDFDSSFLWVENCLLPNTEPHFNKMGESIGLCGKEPSVVKCFCRTEGKITSTHEQNFAMPF